MLYEDYCGILYHQLVTVAALLLSVLLSLSTFSNEKKYVVAVLMFFYFLSPHLSLPG